MTATFPLLIDGQEVDGSDGVRETVIDPATEEPIGEVAFAAAADLDRAMNLAVEGMAEWQAIAAWDRGRILKTAADLLRARAEEGAAIMSREQGKPLAQAKAEVVRSADFLEWGGEQGRRVAGRIVPGRDTGNRIEIETHPIGVIAAFTPWNFPMALAAKKFAGALGAGCSIVCKPSEETPGSVLFMARALLEAGVPAKAIAVVFGPPADVSAHMIPAPQIAKITFTGSIPVGKLLAAEAGKVMKPVTMELGGHAPTIVCGDVDPEAVADRLTPFKFANAGQICLSPTRFFVEESVYERFLARFAENAKAIRVGNGSAEGTQMGPLANERRREAIAQMVDDARNKGARILAGGERVGNKGYFYAPTVLTDLPDDAQMLSVEPFGPVAPVIPFRDEEAMLAQANALEYGLSGYLFTNDAERQARLCDGLQAGTVGINDIPTHPPEVPLGGWKESGYGTEGGEEILAPYQKTKFVSRRRLG